jgi:serine/threonine protein kinase
MSTVAYRLYRAGDIIAGDFIVRRVMEGGLGIVYAVEHHEAGPLVLKSPKRQEDPAVRASFRAEAETWVKLGDHPNIVRAFRVEEIAGQIFVAAELIEADELGRVSLRDYLSSGPLTPTAIAARTADFCYGMEHALSKGLAVHRDIKPENMLVGVSGVLKVTDFGIARAVTGQTARSNGSSLGVWQTSTGNVAGTPPYMAPEQWTAGRQDIRTDIYAFGVVMHEMCYGCRPFHGPSVQDLADQHLRLQPSLPPGLFAGIITRCLSKDPSGRYLKPRELLTDLSGVCATAGIPLPPFPATAGPKARELQALANSLGALGKLVEAVAAARKLVTLEPDRAENWTQLGRLLLESGDTTGSIDAFERSLQLDPTRSAPWNNLGIILRRQQQWQMALRAFDKALECDPLNSGAMLNSTEPLQRLGRSAEAVSRLKQAGKLAPDKFAIWNNLGVVYMDQGDKRNAIACFQRARSMAPEAVHAQIDEALRHARAMPD